ncbi:MAG TPA: hypothetical protein VFQ23_03360 [Anaerolineales bacterium]|nr:hypothetical protein [Anaerolineales bacterium]
MATFDLNILPIYRINGQESETLPGLLAVTPPRRTARGREKDSLILYIMLTGNATFLPPELMQLNSQAAGIFYQSSGSLTSAMRKAAEHINTVLLERNLSTTGRGQYALAYLALASVRENQCTLLLSGQTHAVWVSEGKSRHIYEPALSGKGLGSSQSIQTYLSQVELHPHDLIVLCGKFPRDWEADLLNERPPASLDAGYPKLTFTKGDLHAALIQAQSGLGTISVIRPDLNALHRHVERPEPVKDQPLPQESELQRPEEPKVQNKHEEFIFPRSPYLRGEEPAPVDEPPITEEELDAIADFAAHMVQPSAYAIPPQPEATIPLPTEEPTTASAVPVSRAFPSSIPRTESQPSKPNVEAASQDLDESDSIQLKSDKPSAHAEAARQMAKAMVGGIRSGRRVNERIAAYINKFVPRLLPTMSSKKPLVIPTYIMIFIAVVIPVLVVTAASAVYLRFGQSIQYEELYGQALNARAQAESAAEPVRQRDEWLRVLSLLDQANAYRETDESRLLRTEAQAKLDNLMGVVRLEFSPAFTGGLGNTTQISRMAASESDLYMLDAERGNILHASFTGRSLNLDTTFNCQPGTHAGYQVGTMVDLLALPKVNAIGATVLGIDTNGNLLYCSPGQVPQAIPLPNLPNTNWGRITAFVLDNGSLYVLDATSRSVWVFVGKDSTFIDTPYFYFSNQIPNIDNAIDLAVSGDDLYLLHADGHLSTCTFSRIDATPTRCVDPATYNDSFPAHLGLDLFTQAHFTQIALTNPPNSVVLLLDSEHQSVYRFTPRSLELQNQVGAHAGKANPFQSGLVGAMAVSPNYVLYLAIGNQVYFATNLP